MVEFKKNRYIFVDTAGIRRRGRIHRGVEQFSVRRAFKTLEHCDLGLILLDGVEGIVEQDTKLIGQTLELGKGCILLINKWDLRQNKPEAMGKFRSELQRRLPFVTYVPTLFISALTGKLVAKIFPLIDRVMTGYTLRIATGDLNRFFEAVT
ncbi:MAG: ribosome biogenesis GTPase Der, partial [Planctomycetales bacterium]|nr:ribosome biogenesis GTPase Der [Planctomycetales bacterium]NIM10229.1 ribosome biogenesis GTPase Der [Planctomycetales bacterium]NIN09643.1 ribosome biogenesis GTPase Der [Planctomycetales bacterium]NIN78759.1 ribosome biogenesis GTPase Der [Planctomycetales bacterium]NIP05821.1 ribosome biogenesis GTPase Der [Planctomycetales bacterium]